MLYCSQQLESQQKGGLNITTEISSVAIQGISVGQPLHGLPTIIDGLFSGLVNTTACLKESWLARNSCNKLKMVDRFCAPHITACQNKQKVSLASRVAIFSQLLPEHSWMSQKILGYIKAY